uniref:(northern house mosquito) hypothetical protein n=1 Tax=Culex pipiens TaxID=7175 RepID=A0A8D8B6U3_CULPI
MTAQKQIYSYSFIFNATPQRKQTHKQRKYRAIVGKYLMFLMNPHNPYAEPPCKEMRRRRLDEFAKIPVPRTKEESLAKKEEEIEQRRARIEEENRLRAERIHLKPTLRPPPPPKRFAFNCLKFLWERRKNPPQTDPTSTTSAKAVRFQLFKVPVGLGSWCAQPTL